MKRQIAKKEIEKKKNVVFGNFNSELLKVRLKEVSGKKHFKDIADDCNINPATLSKKCQGNGLDYSDLLLFAKKYNCSIDYLLGLSDHNNKAAERQQDTLYRYSDFITAAAKLIKHGTISGKKDPNFNCFEIKDPVLKYLFDYLLEYSQLLSDSDDEIFYTLLRGLNNAFDSYLAPAAYYETMIDRIKALQDGKVYNPPLKKQEIYSEVAKESDPINGISLMLYEDIVAGNVPRKFDNLPAGQYPQKQDF